MFENLEFRISSGLKDIIGRDLITDDFIAVFELVKNSYDAFAKNVVITIEDDKITIADDGKGMSLSDLKKKWLFVAFSAKKDDTEDDRNDSYRDVIQERRHYAGAKGIGRFSSDRLGGELAIITKKQDSDLIEQIRIDWSKFEKDQNQEFEKINVLHETLSNEIISFPKNSRKGTILEITNLHNTWDRKRLQDLKHSLEKLINPFSETNDFNIEIICHKEEKKDEFEELERNKVNGKIKNSILEILDIKTTQISVRINKEEIETRIIDRGYPIYHIKERNKEFALLDNAKIDLYFLNTSAKNNFTRKMGIRVVNFGSVFLFKNGFRVQPYGELGDDSWGLDQRKQQGYNRFLGTRDLFGRVDIITNNTSQFKEVTSRDGGLVETEGFYQLMKVFKEKGLTRLERYVVGVLWGEGFKRKNYFGIDDDAKIIAQEYRDKLKNDDKISDDITTATSNIGSKLDFIQIIKGLVSDKDIEILDYNKELVNFVNENINEHQIRFISDLDKIAKNTDDKELSQQILRTEEQYQELKRAKEEAEEKKRLAEIETLKKENERLIAEKRAKEADEKREKAEKKTKITEEQNKYLLATSNTSQEVKDLVHTISINSTNINGILNSIYAIIKDEKINSSKLMVELDALRFSSEKIKLFGDIITKANFNTLKEKNIIDIPVFIKEYISAYSQGSKMEFKFKNIVNKFKAMINLLDIYIIFDNLISNSKKSGAKKIVIDMSLLKEKLIIDFSDNGNGVSQKYIQNPEDIFSIGVTDKIGGSGIGLYTIKTKMKDDLHGDIVFVDNGIEFKKGATFRLKFGR